MTATVGRAHRRPAEGVVGLLVEVLRGSADLRGARCVGHADLFDPDRTAKDLGFSDEDDRWAALCQMCVSCPSRGACWAWSSRQREGRVLGPTATAMANPFRQRRGRPATPTPSPVDPEPELSRPRPAQPRGARSRVRPSINRNRRRNHR